MEAALQLYADFNIGKVRQDVVFTMLVKSMTISTYALKTSTNYLVNYQIRDGHCTCSTLNSTSQVESLCIPASNQITKAMIGQYQAKKIVYDFPGMKGNTWVFSEKCWLLSAHSPTQVSLQEIAYFDQVEKVDYNVFKVPGNCPTVDKCEPFQ